MVSDGLIYLAVRESVSLCWDFAAARGESEATIGDGVGVSSMLPYHSTRLEEAFQGCGYV